MVSRMKVNEIFSSIQGESTWVGRPTTFVRLTGCNLKCTWCDTGYAREEGQEMTPQEVIEKIESMHNLYVCFTGGEPLLQYDELMDVWPALKGQLISVETNGAVPIQQRPNVTKFVMDIKCPGSGAPESYYQVAFQNAQRLNEEDDELKFVVADDLDLKFVESILESLPLGIVKIMSPVWGKMDYEKLAKWVMEHQEYNAMMQVQLHKIIWGSKRGV